MLKTLSRLSVSVFALPPFLWPILGLPKWPEDMERPGRRLDPGNMHRPMTKRPTNLRRVYCRRSRYPAAQRSSYPPLGPDNPVYSTPPRCARRRPPMSCEIWPAKWSAEGRPTSLATTTSFLPPRILTSHTRPVGLPLLSSPSWSTSTLSAPLRAAPVLRHLGEQYRRGRPRPVDAGNSSLHPWVAHTFG